jgi:hypothetical protein
LESLAAVHRMPIVDLPDEFSGLKVRSTAS